MAGLLDNRVGDALKGALGAGALGVNPAIGLLFGKGIRESRERREMENKQLRDSMAAKDEMGALFSRMDTVQTPGQSVAGPGRLVPGILAGPDGVGSDPVQIPGRREWVPGAEKQVPAIQTPQGQHELMGLLARVDPAAAAQAAMPQQGRADPAAMREMQRLGYPMTPEGFQQYHQDRGTQNDPMSALAAEMAAARLEGEQRRNEQEQLDADARREEREFETNEYVNNLSTSSRNLMDLYVVNERLSADEGIASMLTRPGIPLSEVRKGIASIATPEAAADVHDFDSLVSQIAIERLNTEGFEGNTNARFGAFTDTKPSFERLGAANQKTILRNLKGVLLADQAKGRVMPEAERREIERFIRRVEGQGVSSLREGDVEDGYEYMGGPPGDPKSWRKTE